MKTKGTPQGIEKAVSPYAEAVRLRTLADRDGSPQLYERAAERFRVLGMHYAAQRCLDRAAHCRETQERDDVPDRREAAP